MSNPLPRAQRALLSVSNKEGLVGFARALHEAGLELVASGGTAQKLRDAEVPVVAVEAFTGATEVLEGRVKTLHPKIHAGILADRRKPEHLAQLETHRYAPIDVVVCNLYPFIDALKAGASHDAQVEKIDIGGPTLVRAAAKNADGGVTVVTDPSDYNAVVEVLRGTGTVPLSLRRRLAAKAFRQIADYDLAIAAWTEEVAHASEEAEATALPSSWGGFGRQSLLRYGENPHQPSALYLEPNTGTGVAHGTQLGGKALSYNNYLDLDAAYRAAYRSGGQGHRCAIVKHTNPCGLADAEAQADAFRWALEGDPVSAFGSVIAFNDSVTPETADAIRASKLFVECIAAPGFSEAARDVLAKKQNLRLVEVPRGNPAPALSAHRIGGGLLIQAVDPGIGDPAAWEVVTAKTLEPGWLEELAFAMEAVWTLKSNAITVTKGRRLLGAGAGQMSRIDAAEQALKKAGETSRGAFLGSDAFFPFGDCATLAADHGVVAIAQPGGSKRDQESIDACNARGLAMVFTGRRHFRH